MSKDTENMWKTSLDKLDSIEKRLKFQSFFDKSYPHG